MPNPMLFSVYRALIALRDWIGCMDRDVCGGALYYAIGTWRWRMWLADQVQAVAYAALRCVSARQTSTAVVEDRDAVPF